jgi:hypothetical protein
MCCVFGRYEVCDVLCLIVFVLCVLCALRAACYPKGEGCVSEA